MARSNFAGLFMDPTFLIKFEGSVGIVFGISDAEHGISLNDGNKVWV